MNASSEGIGDSAYHTDVGDKSPHDRPSPHTRHFLDLPISRVFLTRLLDFVRIDTEGHEVRLDYVRDAVKGSPTAITSGHLDSTGWASHEMNAEKTRVDGICISVTCLH